MPHRSPARFLAPLALVAAFLSVLVVVNSGGSDSRDSPRGTVTTQTTTTTPKRASQPKKKSYTVKSGDVLSAIAEKTGVPLDRILELNPDLDPQTLRTGQKIKLAR